MKASEAFDDAIVLDQGIDLLPSLEQVLSEYVAFFYRRGPTQKEGLLAIQNFQNTINLPDSTP